MSLTAEEFVSFFSDSALGHRKLFIPGDNDESVAGNLIAFYQQEYSVDLLKQCADYFIAKSHQPVLIYQFALNSNDVRRRLVQENERKQDVEHLLKATKKRMESFHRKEGE
jgi:hypothetical protein